MKSWKTIGINNGSMVGEEFDIKGQCQGIFWGYETVLYLDWGGHVLKLIELYTKKKITLLYLNLKHT